MPANDTIDLSAGFVKAPPTGAIDLSAGYVDKKAAPIIPTATNPPTSLALSSHLNPLSKEEEQVPAPPDTPFPEPVERGLEAGYKYAVAPLNKAGKWGADLFGDYFESMFGVHNNPIGFDAPPTAEGRIPEAERTIPSGVARAVGGTIGGVLTDPRNWPFLAKGTLQPIFDKLISGGFAAQMAHGTYENAKGLIDNWDNLSPAGRAEGLTGTGLGAIMTGLAAHGTVAREPLAPTELDYLNKLIEDNISNMPKAEQESTRAEMKEVVDEFNRIATAQSGQLHKVQKDAASVQGEPAGEQPTTGGEGATLTPTQESGVETLRDVAGTPRGEGDLKADTLVSAQQGGTGGEASQGVIEDEPDILERKIGQLASIVPDFTKAIGGEREERGAQPESGIAGATGDGERAGEPPFVISPTVDSDLADHGVQVTRPGPDIGKIEKYGGSMTEMVRRLSVQGHPLSSILTGIVRQGVDAIKGMMKDTTDTLGGWKRNAKTVVSDKEWQEQVVPLLKDPDVDVRNRPPNVPDNVWKAYTHTRPMLEDLRVRMRDAIRIRMLKVGLPSDYVEEHVPDDWGIPFGYYPGIFEGDYAITKLHGIDENGKENWQPIETGWRDVSEAKAIAKAAAWMKDHPGVPARVQKDTYTLPGKDFSSRAKLIDLAKKLKVGDNTDLEELVSSLYDEAAAAAYGPTRIAPRQYGHALKRESNLPGGATDMESFERFIAGSIRFIHLTPAREGILQLRNKIAEIAGMPEIQRPSDIPANIAYSHATQYPNILSRTDQFISGVEGRPGFSDVELRSALNSIGADPSFMSRVGRVTQEMWSLLKLGFSPVKVLSHGLQSVWAGLPVLGPRYWLEGYAHAYNPKYNDLIQSIAPSEPKFNPLIGGLEAAGNLATWKGSPNTLVEALHTYNADYFSRGTGPIDWTKGTYHLIRDLAMSPFAAGIETTRRVGAVGAYRRALDSGLPEAQARDAASAAVDRISGLYHAADNPTLLRNLPGPIAQFKTFSFKTAQMMYGFRTPAEWSYFLGAIGLLGFAGIPFAKPLSGIALALSGEDVENDLKRKFPVASRGIFGAAGVDIPPGVGVGDLGLTRPQAPLGGILGPAGSDIYSLAKGGLEKAFDPVSRKGDQDFKDAIRNLSPAARRLMDESDRVATNPSTVDPHTGSTILQHLTPLERLEMEGGFTPLRVAEERESHEYIRNLISNEKDKKGFFLDHMAANAIRLSQPNLSHAQQMDIVKETVALGRMAAEEYGIKVDARGVLERAREMMLERLHRDFKLAPKAVRPQIYEEMQRFKSLQGEQ